MKKLLLSLFFIIPSICQAQTSYELFEDVFANGNRVGSLGDLRKIDKCYFISEKAQNLMLNLKYRYSEVEVDYGPVLGKVKVEKFIFRWDSTDQFDISELTFSKVVDPDSLKFVNKSKNKTQTAEFKFGYEDKEIVLAKFSEERSYRPDSSGKVYYFYDFYLGQCTLKKNEDEDEDEDGRQVNP